MKRIVIILIGLISVAYGQSSPTSAKTRFVNGLYVGTKLDSYFAAADSNAIYWRADSALMAKYKGTARALAFAVSGGYIPYSDTTSLLSQVVRTFGTQTVGGNKTFSNDLSVNGLTVGRGGGLVSTNSAFGPSALLSNTTGAGNTAIGNASLLVNTTSSNNTGVGRSTLVATTGAQNTAIGAFAGGNLTTGSNNTYIGYLTPSSGVAVSNETVIGASATGNGSNTVTIGNSSVTDNYFTGNIRGGAFIKSGGTSSQFLKADGSVDGTAYGTGSVTSVAASAGTGISVSGSPITSSGTITITNTAPDQTVTLTAGGGISVTGTYPNFTVTNSSPSSGGTVTSVSAGTGMSFTTITSTGAVNADTTTLATRAYVVGLDVGKANTSLNNVNGVLSSTYGGAGSVSGILKANGLGVVSAAVAGTDYQTPITNPVTGTGTTNYLPKFTGTSSIGNSTIFDNGSEIGLGTASLTGGYRLQVAGLQRNFGANTVLNFGELDANNIYFQGLNLAGDAAKGIVFFGTSEYARFTSSAFTSLVPISGTSLSMSGGGQFDAAVKIRRTSDVNQYLELYSSGGEGFFDAVNSNSGTRQAIIFRQGNSTNTVESGRFASDGNFGIGTTAPEALLHVNKSTAGGEGGYIYVDNPASSTLNSSVGVRFGTSTGASFAGVYTGEISNIVTNASNGASDLLFGTFNGTSSGERMRISSDGTFLINTTTTDGTNKLIVNGGVKASSNILTNGEFRVDPASGDGIVRMYTAGTERAAIRANATKFFIEVGTFGERLSINNSTGLLTYTGAATFSSSISGTSLSMSGSGRFGSGGTTLGKLSMNDGTNINLAFKVGQEDATAAMINAYNDAASANIPLEFRATKYEFLNGAVLVNTMTDDGTNKLIVNGGVKGGEITGNNFIANGSTSTAANVTSLDYFSGKSRLIGFGANTSTAGSVVLAVSSSNASVFTEALTIASTGAATFSSSVTAGAFRAGATNTIGWTSHGGFESVTDGNFRLYNEARTVNGNLTLGAITASSSVTASSFVKSGGTSTQALIADGSVQTLTSGTYTPTITNTTNITSSTARVSYYTRVGDIVTVHGWVALTTTSNETTAVVGISLPISSNLSAFEQLSGSGNTYVSASGGQMGKIEADATNDRATLTFYPYFGASSSIETQFTFSYRVL